MTTAGLLALALALPAEAAPRRTAEKSVVGLDVTFQQWDERRPWAKLRPQSRQAAGVVVEGPWILTTARTVAQATLIRLEKFGKATAFRPRIVLVDPEIDLALLAVDDAEFFSDLRPARVAAESPVEGVVRTLRWRQQQLESLASRIQRHEVRESWYGRVEHAYLLVHRDASGGGWAEPVFHEERLVGLTAAQSEQSAWVIPAELLAAFLERARAGSGYRRVPVFGARWQVNGDRALAAFLGQQGPPRGVLIRRVPWGSSACGVLEPRDLLLSIDGKPIDADGFYTHPRLGRLSFPHIVVDGHRTGDRVEVQVLREGRLHELPMELRDYPAALELVPSRRGDEPPPYLVAGGLVFRELDADYLRSWGRDWNEDAPLQLLARYLLEGASQRPRQRRLVFLAAVLPAAYNVGYEQLRDLPVESVNGEAIDSLVGLAAALERPQEGFHTIRLQPNVQRREVVLDAATLEAATADVLAAYRLPAARRMPSPPPPLHGPACPGDQ